MNIKFSKIIPFKGFLYMNLYGTLFVKYAVKSLWKSMYKKAKARIINHESIHAAQALDYCKVLWIGYTIFYLVYFWQWIILLVTPPYNSAYRDIPFEVEAKKYEGDMKYLENRSKFNWKHIK